MKKLLLLSLLTFISFFLDAQTITTYAGCGCNATFGDGGPALGASFLYPAAVAMDNRSNLYIADNLNNAIRKVSSSGIVTTVAGTFVEGYSGDNGPATNAKIHHPYCIAVDTSGNFYFSDGEQHVIRKVNSLGIITVFAGDGILGYSGDGGPATSAHIYSPVGIAIDNSGNVIFSDGGDNVIRKVTPSGIITTIAGTGVAVNDGDAGNASSAGIYGPSDLTIDNDGNIYVIADEKIRKINSLGIISTITGNGSIYFDTEPIIARLGYRQQFNGIATDRFGNIFVSVGNRVQRISSDGMLLAFAGDGYSDGWGHGRFAGDGGPAIAASLSSPSGLATDNSGNLYIADAYNQRIRRVTPVSTGVQAINSPGGLMILYPNPAGSSFNISCTEATISYISITDLSGRLLYTKNNNLPYTSTCTINDAALPAGTYIVKVNTTNGTANNILIIK